MQLNRQDGPCTPSHCACADGDFQMEGEGGASFSFTAHTVTSLCITNQYVYGWVGSDENLFRSNLIAFPISKYGDRLTY
jgi:hypothetical protein